MTEESNASTFGFLTGLKIGFGLVALSLVYRFLRPYWYALEIGNWLSDEKDYIQDYERSVHPLGYYEFEVQLQGSENQTIYIENKSRRVPVILRAELRFEPGTISTLLDRKDVEEDVTLGNDHTQFLEEVEWAMRMAPGISWFVDFDGNQCTPEDAEGVIIEYRIYPDAVSQHEILNSIVEIANAFTMIRQRESKFAERLNGNR